MSTAGWIILGIVAALLLLIILIYNKLVGLKLKVENNFSQIKIQCKKRFDMIPNLVEIVKGYAKHEKETFEAVIQARNSGVTAETPEELASANNQLSAGLSKLFLLKEAYPELKANVNFLKLQDELAGMEKVIATTRGFYNDTVMMYNRAVQMFPSNLVAAIFGFKKSDFFNAPDEEIENVKIKF